MKTSKSYQLVILHETLAFEDNLQDKLKDIFHEISMEDYVVTITPTPLAGSKFSATIIILKESLEKALPLCENIQNRLTEQGYEVHRQETTLLWGSDAPRFSTDL